jgi:hypothetical protein
MGGFETYVPVSDCMRKVFDGSGDFDLVSRTNKIGAHGTSTALSAIRTMAGVLIRHDIQILQCHD